MHSSTLNTWQHDHVFGQDQPRAGERRTLLVVAVTAVMMVVEIAGGMIYGSMALLADGLHMGSHTLALGLAVLAYVVSRRLAADQRFSFGVGKINSLAGFASAVLLLGFALVMVVESTERLFNPRSIAFDQALIVAAVGLLVNGISAWVLMSTPHDHGHGHHQKAHQKVHDHPHDHDHDDAHDQPAHKEHDHNLRAAYLHVLADALTSILAIFALLAGKYYGAGWLDPAMGIVGAALIVRWSFGLIGDSARVLLDTQSSEIDAEHLQNSIEAGTTDRVTDLHVWSIGHGINAAAIVLVSDEPSSPDLYRSRIPRDMNIVHATVEVHLCPAHGGSGC